MKRFLRGAPECPGGPAQHAATQAPGPAQCGACGCHPWVRPLIPPWGIAWQRPCAGKAPEHAWKARGKHFADSKLSLGSGCLQTGVAHKGPHTAVGATTRRGACPAWPLWPVCPSTCARGRWQADHHRAVPFSEEGSGGPTPLNARGGPSLFGPLLFVCFLSRIHGIVIRRTKTAFDQLDDFCHHPSRKNFQISQ